MSFSKRGDFSLSSLRLQALANFYHGVGEVWDIGCDHGLLGLSFSDIESVHNITFVDPSEPVIRDLHIKLNTSHIPRQNLSLKIQVIHSTGQSLTLSTYPKCIFIAGMGGKEILEITKALIPQMTEADRLVISPHRKILELREYLEQSELGLVTEIVMEENDQFYQIMVLEKKSSLPKITRYGTYLWQTDSGLRYYKKELEAFSRHQDALSRAYVDYLREISAGQSTK